MGDPVERYKQAMSTIEVLVKTWSVINHLACPDLRKPIRDLSNPQKNQT